MAQALLGIPVVVRRPFSYRQAIIWTVLGILVFLSLYPFIFMFITSFKTYDQYLHDYVGLSWPIHYENYAIAWNIISRPLLNSMFVSVTSAVGTVVFASLSAYVFARYKFPGREFLFFAIISLLMVPNVFQLIPRFMLINDFGLLNTYWAVILPYIAGGQIFAIFVLRSFFASLPQELFDAAKIDGASDLKSFFYIAVPLSRSSIATLAILRLQQSWNDYIWPLVSTTNADIRTVIVQLSFLQGQYGTQIGPMFAGYILGSLPLLLIFAFGMKQFIAGMTSGAIKV
jgi:multiple sugar transport system permease protein/raffinose/stachyose/melibiose transport system permease protein